MKFRTELKAPKYPFKISHHTKLFSIGSCFSEEIGSYFSQRGFTINVNPFGTIFNPVSIGRLLSWSGSKGLGVVERDGAFVAYQTHSKITGTSPDDLRRQFDIVEGAAKTYFQSSDVVIVTLGTSFVHELTQSGAVVANCHKQASSLFVKKLLTVNKVQLALQSIIEAYPDKRFLFTVSPVRHTKEGLVENSLSKGTLRLAIEGLKEKNSNVFYFPAYEILIDDLRDYRFYEADMIHPNVQTKDYIWSILEKCFFDAETIRLSDKFIKLAKLKAHRVMNENSGGALQQKIERLEVELNRKVCD